MPNRHNQVDGLAEFVALRGPALLRLAWVDGWRRQGRNRFSVISAADAPGLNDPAADDPGIEGLADRAALAVALAHLAPGQRAVLVLRYYEDQTEAQTAGALGCSVSTVKTQARDALRRLRLLVPEATPEMNR